MQMTYIYSTPNRWIISNAGIKGFNELNQKNDEEAFLDQASYKTYPNNALNFLLEQEQR